MQTPPSPLFEGIVSFRAVLAGGRPISRVLYDEELVRRRPREYAFLRAKADERGFALDLLPRGELDARARGKSHGGLLFSCGEKALLPLRELPARGFFVFLDGVEDPYNFAFALRALYPAGASGVLLPPRNWMSAAPTVCRASAGASELLPLYAVPTASDLRALFSGSGYRILLADSRGAVPLDEADLALPLLLLIGGERRGVSAAYRAASDLSVKIPYARPFVALPTSSAAAILAFAVAHRALRAQ